MTMLKLFIILIVAAILESIGVAFLSGGLKELTGIKTISFSEIGRLIVEVVTNGKILFGVFLEAIFFGALCYMLSQKDVSLVWPLTSMGFIVTTLAAKFVLGEQVSGIRWAGVVLIALGALLTSYSEHQKETAAAPQAEASASTSISPK
jgi:drug/metabolite transporter (DMT)-like permease